MTDTATVTDESPYTGALRPHGGLGCALFGHDWSQWFFEDEMAYRMCRQCYRWQTGDGEIGGSFS